MNVKLCTKNGDLVTLGMLPPFREAPIVIVWGDRIFVHHLHEEYREAFAVALVNAVTPSAEGSDV